MINIYDEDGKVLGKFNLSKATQVATNKENRDTRWSRILRTAMGTYVKAHVTCWEGERDSYSIISPEEVCLFMEKSGYDEKEIGEIFPDYVEKETI